MQKFLSLFERVLFLLIISLLAFIPLYPKLPLINFKGTFVAARLEDFVIAAILGLWIIFLLLSGRWRQVLKDKFTQLIGLFFAVAALSLFSAIFVTQTIDPKLGVLHYLRRVELILLLPVVISLIRTRAQVVTAVLTLAVVVLAVNIYAMGQQYLQWPVISTSNSEFSKGQILYLTPGARVNSTFAGHYDLAVFLVMIMTIAVPLLFVYRKIYWRFMNLGLIAFSGLVLVMTAARQSFVAMVIGVFFSLLLTGKKLPIIIVMILVAAALVYPSQLRDRFISTFTVNLLQQGDRFSAQTDEQQSRSRLNIPTLPVQTSSDSAKASVSAELASDITPGEPTDSTELGVYRSFEIRIKVEWPRAINAFYKNPLLGTGYSSLGLATDNDILRSLGEVGILGTVSFGLILAALFKALSQSWRSRSSFIKYMSIGFTSMVISFVLNSLFIDVFEASKVATLFWILAGFGVIISRMESEQ